jgi:hypothetical protein
MAKKDDVPIYQLKITLRRSKPPIWRRVLVHADITLPVLHLTILRAFGWAGHHLHEFNIHGESYSTPGDWDMYGLDETKVVLGDVVSEGDKFDYTYDFGDDWEHRIVVEKALPPDASQDLPVCIKGRRQTPPDDVGGMWGYDEFVEVMTNPDADDPQGYRDWFYDEWDPAHFDLDAINRNLERVR